MGVWPALARKEVKFTGVAVVVLFVSLNAVALAPGLLSPVAHVVQPVALSSSSWIAESDDVIMAAPSAEFNLTLVRGWNLISVPLVDHGYMASTLGLLPGDEVAGWNSSTVFYDQIFIVGVSPPAADFAINDSTGYWVYASEAETLHLQGAVPTARQYREITIPTGGGWALIGLNTLDTTWKASKIPTLCSGGTIVIVVRFTPPYGPFHAYIPGVPPTDFTLVPGEGYWCWCTASIVLSYDP